MPENSPAPPASPTRSSAISPTLIRLEVKDPRVGMITITGVEVSRISHAKVFFTSLAGSASTEQSVQALQHAAGFCVASCARTLKLRTVPELHFFYDARSSAACVCRI